MLGMETRARAGLEVTLKNIDASSTHQKADYTICNVTTLNTVSEQR